MILRESVGDGGADVAATRIQDNRAKGKADEG